MEDKKKQYQAADLAIEFEKYDALLAASAKLVAEMQSLLERAYALDRQNVEILKKLNST